MNNADDNADSEIGPTAEQLKARFGRDIFRDFDFEDPNFNEHFFDILDAQLAHCPVARSNVGHGYWWVSRNDDVRRIAQDWKTFSNALGYHPNRPEGVPYLYPEECDPPIHTAWRDMLSPFLSPKACAALDAMVREDVNTLIDRFIGRGECELISEFAGLVPGWAFFKNVCGVPIEDMQWLIEDLEFANFGPVSESEKKAKCYAKVFNYLGNFLKLRSQQPPKGDMVDGIAKGVVYKDGSASTWDENLSVLVDLVQGAIATTTYVMGSSIHHLATHPEDAKLLRQNPELIPQAVEEFIRVFPPIVGLGRTCMKDTEISGTKIKQGDFVMVVYSAASRDPRVVENPAKVDITRKNIVHSTFGVGPHRCVGSNLARMQLKATLEEWLKRIPEFSVKPGTRPVYSTAFMRSMHKLELVF